MVSERKILLRFCRTRRYIQRYLPYDARSSVFVALAAREVSIPYEASAGGVALLGEKRFNNDVAPNRLDPSDLTT